MIRKRLQNRPTPACQKTQITCHCKPSASSQHRKPGPWFPGGNLVFISIHFCDGRGLHNTCPAVGQDQATEEEVPSTIAQHVCRALSRHLPPPAPATNYFVGRAPVSSWICSQVQAPIPTSRNGATEFLLEQYSSVEASLSYPIWAHL